ncbi:PIN-like domain-containing protein [Clostridium perfringens]|uniref:PIN-like domain-containing protein n=1 Tax=Clostridium perfringens TaxID=1502 RepID=UPI0039EA589B
MKLNNEYIWKETILVFDSCSILRLYEFCLNNSLELEDIFDCKSQDIILLDQVEREVTNIYTNRINYKKNKYEIAFKNILEKENTQKIINSLKKQCDGYKYSDEFICLLEGFVDHKVSFDEIEEFISENDEYENQRIEKNKLENILKSFFSHRYKSKLTEEELEKKYRIDSKIGLPGSKDINKQKNKIGDYIILNQLVELSNNKNKDITFITADVKSDWFPFNKELKRKELNPKLINWFERELSNGLDIKIISLVEFLEIAKNYISSDINDLIDECIVYELVEEIYNEWYPSELVDIVNKYIEEDGGLQDQIEDSIGSCLDNLSFDECESCKVKEIISCEIEDDVVNINISVDFIVSIDSSAHWCNEDIDLGSTSCHFNGVVNGIIPIEWRSDRTESISIGSQIESINIEYIDLLKVDSDEYEECEEYEEYEV